MKNWGADPVTTSQGNVIISWTINLSDFQISLGQMKGKGWKLSLNPLKTP